jgi:gliding motility-associated-like protein
LIKRFNSGCILNSTKYLLLLLSIFLCPKASSAEVFIVNNNADAGKGSLKEAISLAAANGSSEHDYIYFDLPDLSDDGRTIVLLSPLPQLTSNLTIDASSQKGAVFGISTSRIQLITNYNFENTCYGLVIWGKQNVAVYGLYIRNLLEFSNLYRHYWQGISIKNSKGIYIGAAGKGNVVSGFQDDISLNLHEEGGVIRHYSEDIYIKANFISVEADASTLSNIQSSGLGLGQVYGEVIIGGLPEEGNFFPKGLHIGQVNVSDSTDPEDLVYSLPANILISNNKIGVNYYISNYIENAGGLSISTSSGGGKNKILIEDNVISGEVYGIDINNNGPDVNIRRNYIGTDKTLTKKFPIRLAGIMVYDARQVNIGSDDPADANFVAHTKPVYVYPYSTVSINKNSFFCTVSAFPMLYLDGTVYENTVEILNITSSGINGVASPNSKIELFYADKCGTCAPETYFASTTADGQGNWQYIGLVNGTIIASATSRGTTSEFTRTRIDDNQVVIVSTCSNTGSITGLVAISAQEYKWLDEQGKLIATTLDLIDVQPGKYTLQIFNGECLAEQTFEVQQALQINADNLLQSNPDCENENGSIRGIFSENFTEAEIIYSWKDESGKEISQSSDLMDIKAGSYTLTISLSDQSCVETYGPVILLNEDSAPVDYGQPIVTYKNASCELNNGELNLSFKTIIPRGFRWVNKESQMPVGDNDASIKGLGVGTYQLFVVNDKGCEQFIGEYAIIRDTEIVINDSNVVISSDDCGLGIGSIKGIQVSGKEPLAYNWKDGYGNIVGSTLDMEHLKSGNYQLSVRDANGCEQIAYYPILNTNKIVPVPQVSDVEICGPGAITLLVNNPSNQYSYRLYDVEYSATHLEENSTGQFNIISTHNRSYFISQIAGNCESDRVEVRVIIRAASIKIPNTFTPNGDGINDKWIIKGIENYPNVHLQLFNRYGRKIFESFNYQSDFEGVMNGFSLPIGTYYYVLSMGTICKPFSGSVTLLR